MSICFFDENFLDTNLSNVLLLEEVHFYRFKRFNNFRYINVNLVNVEWWRSRVSKESIDLKFLQMTTLNVLSFTPYISKHAFLGLVGML